MRERSKTRGSNFSFYLSEDQIEKLNEIHWRERKSVSELVREAITDWLKNHAEGNTTFTLDKWKEDPEFKALPTLLSPDEKWSRHIDYCSDKELTEIGIKANNIVRLVHNRRTQEFKKRKDVKTNTLGRV